LRELKAQDYKVEILDIKHSLLFDIRWIADISETEREKMKQLLRDHMARPPAGEVRQKQYRAADTIFGRHTGIAPVGNTNTGVEADESEEDDD
jgi:hypothetical protein